MPSCMDDYDTRAAIRPLPLLLRQRPEGTLELDARVADRGLLHIRYRRYRNYLIN
jgi:hypothetical protein